MTRLASALPALFGSCLISSAQAHTSLADASGSAAMSLINGVLHPLAVTQHLLALMAAGLLAGRWSGQRFEPALWAGFGCLAVGLALAPQSPLPGVAIGLTVLTLLASLLVVSNRPIAGAFALPAVALTCLLVGVDSPVPPDGLPGNSIAAGAGTFLGAGLTVFYLAFAARLASKPWQLIGVRVAASWLGAVALLMMALATVSAA